MKNSKLSGTQRHLNNCLSFYTQTDFPVTSNAGPDIEVVICLLNLSQQQPLLPLLSSVTAKENCSHKSSEMLL